MGHNPPALIISDITMPVMDGYDFYAAVRARSEWVGIPFIFLTARTDSADFLISRNLGADDYLTKPISRDELVTTVRSRLSRFHQAQMGRVQQAYLDSLIALANAIEHRSPVDADHTEHITEIALLLAERLGWAQKRLTDLRFAAILHDIGKIHIPAAVLFKPGPLTDAEWEIVRRHPVTGAEMLKDVPFLADCIPAVRHHHERWNGSGYPDGLAGRDIPEGGRLLAIADALDRMVTERPFAPARSLEAACAEIFELAGRYYDPQMVAELEAAFQDGQLPAIWQPAGERRPTRRMWRINLQP
jgi:putative two-component system response regulator